MFYGWDPINIYLQLIDSIPLCSTIHPNKKYFGIIALNFTPMKFRAISIL